MADDLATPTHPLFNTQVANNIRLVTKTPLLNQGDPASKRQEILDYFHQTFSLYESIFQCLNGDAAFYAIANPLRHPLIFYYGHTSVFFINKLNVARLINQRVNPALESMLAIGVDEMSWDDLNPGRDDWPTPAQVKAHRDQTRQIVDSFIRSADLQLPITQESPFWVILMGIEHERIHLETSAVLLRELPLGMVKFHPLWGNLCQQRGEAPKNKLLPVAGGKVTLGKAKDNPLYGWDNEYGHASFDVQPFKASSYLVSNQEFLAFVQAGGYQTRDHWSEEGWRWVQFRQAQQPVWWVKNEQGYELRTMLALIDMPWDWPAEVNCLEAQAFCAWKSTQTGTMIRLPSEAEWYQLRSLLDTDQPYWDKAPGNINLEYDMSPCPVNKHAFENGFFDIIGNVWQWTSTPIDGFEGFEVHPVYDDFSTPTFDGKHNLFKGGSWISTGNYAIKDSRYAFRRHFFQFSGFRYIEGQALPEPELNVYEEPGMVSQYIEFHYGATHFNVPNFPATCARICIDAMHGRPMARALDLGCATGRSSFELATAFEHVDAIDFSARLIEVPVNLQKNGLQRYIIQDEGELVSYKAIGLTDFNGYEQVKHKVVFMQGDACNLADKFTHYDLVFAGNLIDRLYKPEQFLSLIKTRIRPGGLLILTSPYTWLKEFTDRAHWLGGFKAKTGENYTTLDGLTDCLQPEFKLHTAPRDVEFVIRETRRKFQHSVAQLSIWEKNQ
jgi:5-histidylcysteine sulfoxide synthase/putative 4-mercaptohistidine N1-methyltranferase